MPDTSENPDSPPPKSSRWHAPMILAVVLLAVAFSQTVLNRGQKQGGEPEQPAGEDGQTVAIEVDDGERKTDLAAGWSKGATALSALEAAVGRDQVERTGDGAQAFVFAIRGLRNEGAAGRNWQYFVNGERGEVGAGAQAVEPGDRVLWSFAPYE